MVTGKRQFLRNAAVGAAAWSPVILFAGFAAAQVEGRKAEKEGVYYGRRSKIRGKDHAFTPSAILVVSREKYDEWRAHRTRNSRAPTRPCGSPRARKAGDRQTTDEPTARIRGT